MPWGIRYYDSPPPEVQTHISDIVSCIHSNETQKMKDIFARWHSDDSIRDPEPDDLELALTEAARVNNVSAASALLDEGATINSTAVTNASSEEMFESFVAHGWDINTPVASGMPVLQQHVDNLPMLRWFLSHGAVPNFTSETSGLTILDIAAASASIHHVSILLDHGADPRKSSALQNAAGAMRIPEPTSEDPYPKFIPAESQPETDNNDDRVPVLKLLLKKGAEIDAIEYKHAGESVVANITAPGRRGRKGMVLGTALHCAVKLGAVGRVRFLLENGADAEAVDSDGKTVVELALQQGNRKRCLSALSV
ncbi:ankyrin repeat-containing domain protein [Massariosphaeria phaeospora]|uniref:Ankyrin repeat-containing domain protein n=1 Tax=Massariosphaeria phaeospora TaxID=100035 RepID=A0A7C8HYZ8_9PLEO|nr:ankyrin repeat-containing domain protein [Massariosphaeria phaeospora]